MSSDFLERVARDHLGAIARKLIGEPNRQLSTREELRFGTNGSLKVNIAGPHRGTWHSFELEEKGGLVDFLRVYAGVENHQVVGWLRDEMGFVDDDEAEREQPRRQHRITATWDYYDEQGRVAFQVVRWDTGDPQHPKTYSQRRPNGRGGWEPKGPAKEALVPYNLPELLRVQREANGQPWRLYIAEGEKCCDRLRSDWGLTTTTNPGGAGKWLHRWNTKYFDGADIVILADNDEKGRKHADDVANGFLKITGSRRNITVRIVHLPGLAEKGDVYDWMTDGGDQSTFEEIVDTTEVLRFDSDRKKRLQTVQRFDIVHAHEVEPEPINWLWPGYFARGKLALLAGHPGLGKSTGTLDFAATLSRGGQWPDGSRAPAGRILILSSEDDERDTIVPRLMASGADLRRVSIIRSTLDTDDNGEEVNRGFALTRDVERLSDEIEASDDPVVAVIIDPVTAYFGQSAEGQLVDANSQSDVRSILLPFTDMARKFNVAILAVTHLKKSTEGDAVSLVSGSTALPGTARIVLLYLRDLDDPKRRLFLVAKNNLGPDGKGFAYRIPTKPIQPGSSIIAPYVEWEAEPLDKTADEELAERRKRERTVVKDQNRNRLEVEFVKAECPTGHNVAEIDLRAAAKAAGFSWAKVLTALTGLGAVRVPIDRDLANKPTAWGYRIG